MGGAAQIEGVRDEREAAQQVGEAIGPGSARREPVPRGPLVLEVSPGSASGANIRPVGTRW